MRFATVPLLVVGAGIAIHDVTAAPMRVIIASSGTDLNSANIRFGHAVKFEPIPVHASYVIDKVQSNNAGGRPRPCRGGGRSKFKQQAIEMSNAFRQVLGLPLIETDNRRILIKPTMQLDPLPFVEGEKGRLAQLWVPPAELEAEIVPSGLPPSRHWRHNNHIEREPFLRRIHFALMALGPWEGRAVAFVLGCGIGVLLRMVWVVMLLTFRSKTTKPDEEEELQADAEEIFVAPPQYFADEKTPVISSDDKDDKDVKERD